MKKYSVWVIMTFAFLTGMTIISTMEAGETPIQFDSQTREFFLKNSLLLETRYYAKETKDFIAYAKSAKTKRLAGEWIMSRVYAIFSSDESEISDFCRFSMYALFLEETKIPLSKHQKKLIYDTIQKMYDAFLDPLYSQDEETNPFAGAISTSVCPFIKV